MHKSLAPLLLMSLVSLSACDRGAVANNHPDLKQANTAAEQTPQAQTPAPSATPSNPSTFKVPYPSSKAACTQQNADVASAWLKQWYTHQGSSFSVEGTPANLAQRPQASSYKSNYSGIASTAMYIVTKEDIVSHAFRGEQQERGKHTVALKDLQNHVSTYLGQKPNVAFAQDVPMKRVVQVLQNMNADHVKLLFRAQWDKDVEPRPTKWTKDMEAYVAAARSKTPPDPKTSPQAKSQDAIKGCAQHLPKPPPNADVKAGFFVNAYPSMWLQCKCSFDLGYAMAYALGAPNQDRFPLSSQELIVDKGAPIVESKADETWGDVISRLTKEDSNTAPLNVGCFKLEGASTTAKGKLACQ